jgi:transcriptional regulator with XRE-family HTH domain
MNIIMDLASFVGSKIKQKRNDVRMSQDKLALLADIDRSYIGRIERGEVNITLEKLYEIADVLDCDAKTLLP